MGNGKMLRKRGPNRLFGKISAKYYTIQVDFTDAGFFNKSAFVSKKSYIFSKIYIFLSLIIPIQIIPQPKTALKRTYPTPFLFVFRTIVQQLSYNK
jgi:hypothetical protein